MVESCIPLTWNQLFVEQGYSSECAKKRSAAKQWETIIDEINLQRPQERPSALLPGDDLFPPNLSAHPSWAYHAGRVVVERQQQAQAQYVHRVPMHPGHVPLSEVWGGNPWGSSDVEGMEPTPKATPQYRPKRARTDGRPDLTSSQSSQAAASSTAPPPPQPEQERSDESDWAEVPVPEGAVEYSFDFHKEDLQLCRGKLVHALDNPDSYIFAYDETPLYKPNENEGTLPIEHYVRRLVVYLGRLQSVTQNKSGGLNVQVYVKAGTSKWLHMYARMYHGCGIGTCEHLPTPAMLTAAALVKTEDDLKKDENDTFASASPEVKKERMNVLQAAKEIRDNLAIGGKPDATLVRTQHTFLAMDVEMYAHNKKTTFSLSEAFLHKGWRHLTKLSPEMHTPVNFENTIKVFSLLKQKVRAMNEDLRATTTIHLHLCLQAVVYENLIIPGSTESVAALGNMEETLERVYIDHIKEVIALVPAKTTHCDDQPRPKIVRLCSLNDVKTIRRFSRIWSCVLLRGHGTPTSRLCRCAWIIILVQTGELAFSGRIWNTRCQRRSSCSQ